MSLAPAALIVILQKKNCASLGQVPAEVFDATVMTKPIVAADDCDPPKLLGGCAWIAEPDRSTSLAEEIRQARELAGESGIQGHPSAREVRELLQLGRDAPGAG